MRVTGLTKRALAYRKMKRDLLKLGWEGIGERGGNLWEIYRGFRTGRVILDVRIAPHGKSLFVKIGKPDVAPIP